MAVGVLRLMVFAATAPVEPVVPIAVAHRPTLAAALVVAAVVVTTALEPSLTVIREVAGVVPGLALPLAPP